MRAFAALWSVALAATLGSVAIAADGDWSAFQFEAYNREYVNVRSNTEWEQGGPVSMKVRSPAHRLVIRDHGVELRPRGEGAFDVRVRVNFSGEGDLVADIGLVGAETRMEDHVVVPLQEIEVEARVRFTAVEGGYEIETLELPEVVNVAIESRLGGQLVDTCKSTLAILGINCRGLDAMFSNAPVPMPKPGGHYFISEDQLSDSERRRLNRFLERHG